ncbi:MAG: Lrp/AsnC family transcriptional regulator [Nanoarchaeota archaeon]
MPAKLDQKDRIILYEFDKNARQPLSAIAKKARMSREAVLYRVRGYLKEGIIRSFLTVVDMAKLGITHTKLYLKLHNTTADEEKGLITSLVNNPMISYVGSCDGRFDLHLAIKSRSLVELNQTIMQIRAEHLVHIKEEVAAPIISANHFYRDYLLGKRGSTERRIFWGGNPKPVILDPTNMLILDLLTQDARMTAVVIAQQAGLSPDAVIKRIRSLESQGIIAHYMTWPDVTKLVGSYYKVHITLKNLLPERERELTQYCLDQPNIVYIVRVLASWQLELDIETEDSTSYRKIIRDFTNRFSDIITDTNTLTVYDEHKFRFFEKECLRLQAEIKK